MSASRASRIALGAMAWAAIAPALPAMAAERVVDSRIEGAFYGWSGWTVFYLANGQIWRQVDPGYAYHYAYRPHVRIEPTDRGYRMHVTGVDDTVGVEEITHLGGRSSPVGTGAKDSQGFSLALGVGYLTSLALTTPSPYSEVRIGLRGTSLGYASSYPIYFLVRQDLADMNGIVPYFQLLQLSEKDISNYLDGRLWLSPAVFPVVGIDFPLFSGLKLGAFSAFQNLLTTRWANGLPQFEPAAMAVGLKVTGVLVF